MTLGTYTYEAITSTGPEYEPEFLAYSSEPGIQEITNIISEYAQGLDSNVPSSPSTVIPRCDTTPCNFLTDSSVFLYMGPYFVGEWRNSNGDLLPFDFDPAFSSALIDGSQSFTFYRIQGGTIAPEVETFSIGGTVTGLASGASVVLLNNGGDSRSVSANGGFTFDTVIDSDTDYAVTVGTQPVGQTCEVTSGSGTATANVTGVAVTCNNDISEILSGIAASASSTQEGSEVTLTVVVRDSADGVVSGIPVALVVESATVDAAAVSIVTSPTTTNTNGEVVFTVSSSVAQTVRFEASFNPVLPITVTWTSPPAPLPTTATPVPTLPFFGLLCLAGLMGLLGRRKLSA